MKYDFLEEKQFVCPTCNKGYTKRDDLKNHLSIHNDTTIYSCKACEKSFRILTNLKRHLKTHTSEYRNCFLIECSLNTEGNKKNLVWYYNIIIIT